MLCSSNLVHLEQRSVCAEEIVVKIMGFGFNHFFYGPERWWNAFDLVIITTSVIETFLDCRVWVMPVSVFVDLICFC